MEVTWAQVPGLELSGFGSDTVPHIDVACGGYCQFLFRHAPTTLKWSAAVAVVAKTRSVSELILFSNLLPGLGCFAELGVRALKRGGR